MTPRDSRSKSTRLRIFFLEIFFVSLAWFCAGNTLIAQSKPLTGTEFQQATLANVQKWVSAYQATMPPGGVKGEYFAKTGIQTILSAPGCVGIRVYYARKDDGKQVLVLVGVDMKGNDLSAGCLIEDGFPCPPICDSTRVITH
jgi:hypothetical protein